MTEVRSGIGLDVHPFVENRPLVIGGVKIDYPLGLAGHSDADVLIHAVIDALLGAAGLGDIGRHFPDTDEKYRGISSVILLERTRDMIIQAGWRIGNIDATIIAQKPKFAPYMEQIIRRLATTLAIEEERVNIKATTTEKLGFTGRGEGIAALATASLWR
jgi:2-C-methyl-D-erythritol 2,4-cyclodiphosphate synthase